MCKNRKFHSSIPKVCEQRNDLWAMEVKGHIAFVNHVHSEDAVCHEACSANFCTGKGILHCMMMAQSQNQVQKEADLLR